MGCSKSSAKREVFTNTSLPQETREPSNTQSNFALKQQKRRTKPPKVSRRKEIINIRAEINEKKKKEIDNRKDQYNKNLILGEAKQN